MDDEASAIEPTPAGISGPRLETWKQIAAYLNRDVRTVQRWEKSEGLPVRRHLHAKVATVYADPRELELWWRERGPRLESREGRPVRNRVRRMRLLVPAVLAAGAAALVFLVPRTSPDLQTSTRRLWSGPDTDHFGGVSSDGRWLAFADKETEDLSLVELATGRQRRLTQKPPRARTGGARHAVFSPDDSRIAYSWDEGSYVSIRVIDADGRNERVLLRDSGIGQAAFAWSPDGLTLALLLSPVDETNRVFAFDIASGSRKLLAIAEPGSAGGITYSPDGKWIAFGLERSSGNVVRREIYVVASSGGKPSALIRHADSDVLLGWKERGILFGCDRSGGTDVWLAAVSGGAARGEPALVFKGLGEIAPLGMDRRGSLYFGRRTSMQDVYIAEFDLAGGMPLAAPRRAPDRFAGLNGSPDWSADGTRLAYVPMRRAPTNWPTARVVVREASGGQERTLPVALAMLDMVRWCPDGRSLLGTGLDTAFANHLVRIDAGTGETASLVSAGHPRYSFHEPICLPGGDTILFKRRAGAAEPAPLLSMDVRSKREKQLLPSVYRAALSADGTRLLYSTFDDRQEHIGILPLTGTGPAVKVYSEPRAGRIVSVAWAPGEKQILFAKSGKLWRIGVGGGTPEQLPLEAEALREIRVHPGGKRIAFTAGSSAMGEVWVAENLLPR